MMKNSSHSMDRKTFMKEGARALFGAISFAVESVKKEVRGREHIRPPGAVGESDFLEKCNLCDKCIEACPHDVIEHLNVEGPGRGTPVIVPEDAPCYLCDPPVCSQVCPEDALLPIEMNEIMLGSAIINEATCLAHAGVDRNCDYCYDRCPLQGRAITFDRGPHISKTNCNGCGICAYYCVSNPKSVKIIPI
jgi:ferredoxin-type protein NapH